MKHSKSRKHVLRKRAAEYACPARWAVQHGPLAQQRIASAFATGADWEHRRMRARERVLLKTIYDLRLALKTSREIATYEGNRYAKLNSAVRDWGRRSIDETRPQPEYFNHPLKRLQP